MLKIVLNSSVEYPDARGLMHQPEGLVEASVHAETNVMSMNAMYTRESAPVRAASVPVANFDYQTEWVKLETCTTKCKPPTSAA